MSLYRIVSDGLQLQCFTRKGEALAALRASGGRCSLEKLVYDSTHTESWFEPVRAHSRLSDALNALAWKARIWYLDLLIDMKGV